MSPVASFFSQKILVSNINWTGKRSSIVHYSIIFGFGIWIHSYVPFSAYLLVVATRLNSGLFLVFNLSLVVFISFFLVSRDSLSHHKPTLSLFVSRLTSTRVWSSKSFSYRKTNSLKLLSLSNCLLDAGKSADKATDHWSLLDGTRSARTRRHLWPFTATAQPQPQSIVHFGGRCDATF